MTTIPTVPSTSLATDLHSRIADRTARTAVIGLGYVGLPLAVEFARAGFETIGIDLDARKVASIASGQSYIPDVRSEDVAHFARDARLTATADFSVLQHVDTVNICVPTPLRKTKDPDLSYVVNAAECIAKYLHPGLLVILESTTYPGTTDEVILPILEAGGLVAGQDFFLAFSPERVDPGNARWNTRNVPKVVGGCTPVCTSLAKSLYEASIETVVEVSSTRVAEMVKLLENTFRAVNIGLVNELALMCDKLGLNVWEVVAAAATKPFGFMPFYPGPGLGGHCIPIDPYYLSWKVKELGFEARMIEVAGSINGAMPYYVVEKINDALNSHSKSVRGSSVLVLGIAYKKDVNDIRESPSLDVIDILIRKGGRVAYHDPHAQTLKAHEWAGQEDLDSVECTPEALRDADCVVILTGHTAVDYDAVVKHARLIVDARNVLGTKHPTVFQLGAPSPKTLVSPRM